MRDRRERKRELALLLALWIAAGVEGRAQEPTSASAPAAPAATAPAPVEGAPVSAPASTVTTPKLDLIVEEAKKGLLRKADSVRTFRDLGEHAKAVARATEHAHDWQRLANQWRAQALDESAKAAAGKATMADADRQMRRYAQGEAETQKAFGLLADVLAASGRYDEHDRLLVTRLSTLAKKASHPALTELLRVPVAETESRLLSLASGRADRGEGEAAFALLTRLHADTKTESRRRAVMERLLAFYSDLISNRRFSLAGKVALWYARQGDERSHTWREETLRLARLALSDEPRCAGGGESAKASEGGALELAHLLCRFFVDPGFADGTVYFLLGRAHHQAGELERAVSWYRTAASERDHEPQIQVGLARALAAMGRLDESGWAAMTAVRLGFPAQRILDDLELAAIRPTAAYAWLKNGSLF